MISIIVRLLYNIDTSSFEQREIAGGRKSGNILTEKGEYKYVMALRLKENRVMNVTDVMNQHHCHVISLSLRTRDDAITNTTVKW